MRGNWFVVANGFGIHFYDGSEIFPPTDSEARAECGEYDRLLARVRCRTEVRTWYRASRTCSSRWSGPSSVSDR